MSTHDPCGGSYHDYQTSSKKEKDDRIKKAVPKDQPLSKSAVKSDGTLQMPREHKPQFA